MKLYFDTAYVAKCYLNEPDHRSVRKLARKADGLYSSGLCLAEFACVLRRHVREGSLRVDDAATLRTFFLEDVRDNVWLLIPVTNQLLLQVESRVSRLDARVFLRAGDAIHLVSASGAGFTELWTKATDDSWTHASTLDWWEGRFSPAPRLGARNLLPAARGGCGWVP